MQLQKAQFVFTLKQCFEFPLMRLLGKFVVGMTLLGLGIAPAVARPPFGAAPISSPTNYPGAPRPVYNDGPREPYAMNYADEAVQSLGFRNGHMDVFSTKPPENQSYLPSLSGGVDGNGAMLKLQWHPGE